MKSTPLLLIILFSLSASAQDIAGTWVSYSTVWKGKERFENNKWERITLKLLKDSTYIKQYYVGKNAPTKLSVQLHTTDKGSDVKVKSNANALNQAKKIEKGTYTLRKSINEINLMADDSAYNELYTFEKGELIRAIPMEAFINSTEKYMYMKFKLKKKF